MAFRPATDSMKRFQNESQIHELLDLFETATISRDRWKHAEHLTVALCYASEMDVDAAVERMRLGIFKLLDAFGVDLTMEMPYHETLTVFWMRAVAEFNASNSRTSLLDKANDLVATYDKDYPLRFYSREYLFSDEARAKFIEGDLAAKAVDQR